MLIHYVLACFRVSICNNKIINCCDLTKSRCDIIRNCCDIISLRYASGYYQSYLSTQTTEFFDASQGE